MAISAVQSDHKSITAVELKYSAESLLDSDIIIDLLDQGLMLRFEPRSQRLRMVEAYDLAKIHLKYSNASFSGPDTVPSFKAIYGRFGPSFPGVYDQKRLIYNLHYPGISFSFPIPPIYENLKENGSFFCFVWFCFVWFWLMKVYHRITFRICRWKYTSSISFISVSWIS